jgi:hypothetical protein
MDAATITPDGIGGFGQGQIMEVIHSKARSGS